LLGPADASRVGALLQPRTDWIRRHRSERGFHERTDWRYEEEWRLIVPLAPCRKTTTAGSPLYLFSIEPPLIESVTFGVRTPDPLKQEVLAALGSPQLQHVTQWHIVEGNTPMELRRVQLP